MMFYSLLFALSLLAAEKNCPAKARICEGGKEAALLRESCELICPEDRRKGLNCNWDPAKNYPPPEQWAAMTPPMGPPPAPYCEPVMEAATKPAPQSSVTPEAPAQGKARSAR